MRVYLPGTLPRLAAVLDAQAVADPPLRAFAVTDALRSGFGDDEEELAYEALTAAAAYSLELLRQDPAAPPRRVVIAADVDDAAVAEGGPDADGIAVPAAVTVTREIPLRRVASAHVDEPDAEQDIKLARAGEPDRADGRELLWYATQELGYLVADTLER